MLFLLQDAENRLQNLIDLIGDLLPDLRKCILNFSLKLFSDGRVGRLIALLVRVGHDSCHANVVKVSVLTVNLQQTNDCLGNNRLDTQALVLHSAVSRLNQLTPSMETPGLLAYSGRIFAISKVMRGNKLDHGVNEVELFFGLM